MINMNRSSGVNAEIGMRNFVAPLTLFLLFLIGLVIYGFRQFGTYDSFAGYSLANPQTETAANDQNTNFNHQNSDPVTTFTIFWEKSESGEIDQVERLISGPGRSYSDHATRCGNIKADDDNVPGLVAVPSLKLDRKGWQYESIIEFRDYIAKNRFPEKNIKLLSTYGDEAIVSVDYIDNNLPGIATVFQYFFLVRNDDRWTIFMVVNDPLFNNPSYAGQNCQREQ